MNAYRPRRASKRWMEGAPPEVLSCHDNKGKTFDRYTVYFGPPIWTPEYGPNHIPYLGMSEYPTHPQGFGQHGEAPAWCREASGKKCRWLDLPEQVRQCVLNDIRIYHDEVAKMSIRQTGTYDEDLENATTQHSNGGDGMFFTK